MYVIRDIMHCKPGQVRPLVDKFKAMAKLTEQAGLGKPTILTDVSAERFWTVVAEFRAESLDQFVKDSNAAMSDGKAREIMKGYHDLVAEGRREIYTIED